MANDDADRNTDNRMQAMPGELESQSISNDDKVSGQQLSGNDANENGNMDAPKKRHRRTANEINRNFVCYCGKAYGSEGSLNQHKKNKGHLDDNAQAQMLMENSGCHGEQNLGNEIDQDMVNDDGD